jgi:hypothetical protein
MGVIRNDPKAAFSASQKTDTNTGQASTISLEDETQGEKAHDDDCRIRGERRTFAVF